MARLTPEVESRIRDSLKTRSHYSLYDLDICMEEIDTLRAQREKFLGCAEALGTWLSTTQASISENIAALDALTSPTHPVEN